MALVANHFLEFIAMVFFFFWLWGGRGGLKLSLDCPTCITFGATDFCLLCGTLLY